jgi:hypothetical protein
MNFFIEFHAKIHWPVGLQERVARISHDFQKPGASIAAVKAAEKSESAQIGFLNDVVGIVAIADEPPREVVGRVQMGQHNLFEAPGIAGSARFVRHAGITLSIYQTGFQPNLFPRVFIG